MARSTLATELRGVAERATTKLRAAMTGRPIPRWFIMLGVGLVAFVLIVTRRPDAVFDAQFWAEDGARWYQQAYNQGAWQSLLTPSAGYLLIVPRLVTVVAILFPLSAAPLVYNCAAILIQILPAALLFSQRFDRLIPNWYVKALLAFLYIGVPNSLELDATLTNAIWHLALLSFLVLIAAPPVSRAGRTFDIATVALTGLSGPFAIVLLPVIALYWYRTRKQWSVVLLAVDIVVALIQGAIVALSTAQRSPAPLGATPMRFIRIVDGQLYFGATIGMNGYAQVGSTPWWASIWAPLVIFALGTGLLAYAAWKAPLELRLLLLYGALILAGGLAAPLASLTQPQWEVMLSPGAAPRYEFVLILAWLGVLTWLLCRPVHAWMRMLALVLLTITFAIGIQLDWVYPPYHDYHFASYATEFERAPTGTRFDIPINPPGWTMTLIKH